MAKKYTIGGANSTSTTPGADKKYKVAGDFKNENGYTRAGSVFKSTDEKEDLKSTQKRMNKFTPAQNQQAVQAMKVNTTTPKRSDLNYDEENGGGQGQGGLPKEGDYKSAAKKKSMFSKSAKFRP